MAKGRLKDGSFRLMPDRAFNDTGLSATDYRVLAAIAFHDRGGANGRGCYATHESIAKRAQCHRVEVTRSISKLKARGHIIVTAAAGKDTRRRAIRIVYEIDDKGSGNAPETSSCVAESLQGEPDMCNRVSGDTALDHEVTGHKDILLSAQKGYAAEAAPNIGSARTWSGIDILALESDTAFLSVLSREVSTGRTFSTDVADLLYARLDAVFEQREIGDPVCGQAYRLLETELSDGREEDEAYA